MTDWSETFRGTVPPWQCDVTEHFTIAYYFDRLEEAEANLADELGVAGLPRRGACPAGSMSVSRANCAPAPAFMPRARRLASTPRATGCAWAIASSIRPTVRSLPGWMSNGTCPPRH